MRAKSMPEPIALPSGRKIGDGEPCFIVAEVGSNWRTLEDCLDSIRGAKACGADAVKFQLYSEAALYGVVPQSQVLGTPMDMPGKLPLDWLPKLRREADKVGIEFMCSAFSPELAQAVNPFVNLHKVASAECTHVRLLEKLNDLGKPVVLSTGAHGHGDIDKAIKTLDRVPIILCYCVAAYPAKDIMLETILGLESVFPNTRVGYSDHSTDIRTIPWQSVAQGACLLEKHFTAIEAETPDKPHSLTIDEFKRMVIYIRTKEAGQSWLGAWGSPEETPMILRHNRRLIATRDIWPGDLLTEGLNYGIYRSLKDDTHALSPWAVAQVHGKKVVKPIKAGDGIGPGDFDP